MGISTDTLHCPSGRQAVRWPVDGWVSYIRAGGEQAGGGGEDGDDPDRGRDAVQVGEDAGEQCPDGEPTSRHNG